MNTLRTLLLFALILICQVQLTLEATANDSSETGIIRMNTRLFDLGVDLDSLRRDPDFIPLNRADWLGQIIANDPLLQGEVIHIRVLPQPVTQLWSLPGPGLSFKYSENIPEELIFEGFETRSEAPDSSRFFYFLPKGNNPSFSATCWLDTPTRKHVTFCSLYATYPPDPNIFILARIYNPERYEDLPSSFRAIANRIREIAYCLDVTGKAPQEIQRPSSLDALEGCEPKFTS